MPLLLSFLLMIVFCAASPAGAGSAPNGSTGTPKPKFIGNASMKSDGTIVLDMFIPAPARFEYEPGHEKYEDTLRHVGGLKPGEKKGLPPWPDGIDDARVEEVVREFAAGKGWPESSYRLWIPNAPRNGLFDVYVTHFTDDNPRAASFHLRLSIDGHEIVQEMDD